MKKFFISLLMFSMVSTTFLVHGQDVVITTKTAQSIAKVKDNMTKEKDDADREMTKMIEKAKKQKDIDAQDGAKKAQQKAEKDYDKKVTKAKKDAEKKKLKAQGKADKRIADIKKQEAITM